MNDLLLETLKIRYEEIYSCLIGDGELLCREYLKQRDDWKVCALYLEEIEATTFIPQNGQDRIRDILRTVLVGDIKRDKVN